MPTKFEQIVGQFSSPRYNAIMQRAEEESNILMNCMYTVNGAIILGAVIKNPNDYLVVVELRKGDTILVAFEDKFEDGQMAVALYEAKILEFRNQFKI